MKIEIVAGKYRAVCPRCTMYICSGYVDGPDDERFDHEGWRQDGKNFVDFHTCGDRAAADGVEDEGRFALAERALYERLAKAIEKQN